MKLKIAALYIFYSFSSISFSQETILSNSWVYEDSYAIDRRGGVMYFLEGHDFKIHAIELKTGNEIISNYPGQPVFGNKYPLIAYNDDSTTYIENRITGEVKKILKGLEPFCCIITNKLSPNDSCLYFIRTDSAGVYSFSDNIIYPITPFESMRFYDDYNLLYINPYPANSILKYNLRTGSVDTIIYLPNELIRTFAYNEKHDLLAYISNTQQYTEVDRMVKGRFVKSNIDTILFFKDRDVPQCTVFGIFRELTWDTSFSNLYILEQQETENTFYGYNVDSGKTYSYIERCSMSDSRSHIEWFSANELLYVISTKYYVPAKYNFNIVGIKDKEPVPSKINIISAYPNPFNGSVTISVSNPSEYSKINIYNVTGSIVRSYNENEIKSKVYWDGKGTNSNPLPSGVYFLQFINRKSLKGAFVQKVLYLK